MNRFFTMVIVLASWLSAIPAFAGTEKARVLIVHSYGKTHVCGAPQGEGVIQALAENGWREGDNLEIRSIFMDTKKIYTTPEAIRERGRKALAEVEAFKPQVVVVLDDNAIREVMLPLVGRDDLQLVFSGMNGQPADYDAKVKFLPAHNQPGGNVTGVYEKLHLAKSLRVMAAAIGDLKPGDRVVGITDFSPTGNAITRQFEIELDDRSVPFDWELRRVRDFEEYTALIHELNADPGVRAIYPAALKLQTAEGETFAAGKIFEWTIKHSKKPEMALNYYFSKIGLFGGAAVDFTAMGRMAGSKAARILNGEWAGAIPIQDASDYAIVFNLQRASQLGIDIPKPLLTAADQVYRPEPEPEMAQQD